MKKSIALILALLVIALVFTGCATTSDAGEENEPVALSWNPEVKTDAPAPYTDSQPSSPKNAQKAGLDALFEGTSDWPVNAGSLPVVMKTAEDIQFWDAFKEMFQNDADIDDIEKYLLTWYGVYGWTPEFYAACHNFYFQKALILLGDAASEDDINVAYGCLDKCFDSCFHGAMQYPERLDLWCGYVHAAIMLGDYDNAENCINAIIDRLDFNGNNWYWTYNEPFYEGEEERETEFIQIMHDYVAEFLNYSVLDHAYSVSSRLLDYFPDNTIILNDLALVYLYGGDLEAALPYLERAFMLNPDDLVVMTNLAYVYEDLGEYEASLELANMMILSGEEDYVDRGIVLSAELNSLMNPDK